VIHVLFLHFAHFWVITQQGVVNSYQHFGTTYRCHRQGYKIEPTGFPETSVRNYYSSLLNNSEEPNSQFSYYLSNAYSLWP